MLPFRSIPRHVQNVSSNMAMIPWKALDSLGKSALASRQSDLTCTPLATSSRQELANCAIQGLTFRAEVCRDMSQHRGIPGRTVKHCADLRASGVIVNSVASAGTKPQDVLQKARLCQNYFGLARTCQDSFRTQSQYARYSPDRCHRLAESQGTDWSE